MRKVLIAVAVAALAIAAGPPALAAGAQTEKAYQADQLEKVSLQDLGYTARAVYHPAADEAMPGIMVSEKSAGKKKAADKEGENSQRRDRASAPAYHLRL